MKVLVAGLAKSGTRTICHALNELGINAYHSEDAGFCATAAAATDGAFQEARCGQDFHFLPWWDFVSEASRMEPHTTSVRACAAICVQGAVAAVAAFFVLRRPFFARNLEQFACADLLPRRMSASSLAHAMHSDKDLAAQLMRKIPELQLGFPQASLLENCGAGCRVTLTANPGSPAAAWRLLPSMVWRSLNRVMLLEKWFSQALTGFNRRGA